MVIIAKILTDELAPHIKFQDHEERDNWLYNFNGNVTISKLSKECIDAWYWYLDNVRYVTHPVIEVIYDKEPERRMTNIYIEPMELSKMLTEIDEAVEENQRLEEHLDEFAMENLNDEYLRNSWEYEEQKRLLEIQHELAWAYQLIEKHKPEWLSKKVLQ